MTLHVSLSCTPRDLVHYRGEPDPFKGDALNERVREAAKEAIELLYNATVQQQSQMPPGNMQVGRAGGGRVANPSCCSIWVAGGGEGR